MVLHAIVRSVSFIGDFDSALVKSVEDELVDKIMDRYEALCTEQDSMICKHSKSASVSSEQIAHDLVIHLIHDVSTGSDIAKRTEHLLGVFKVRATLKSYCCCLRSDVVYWNCQSHSSIHTRTFCADLVSAMDGLVQSGVSVNRLSTVAL